MKSTPASNTPRQVLNSRLHQELRLTLLETRNRHALIATEVVASLLWCFFDEKTPLKAVAANY
jgi:hypothetical protein